MTRPWGLPLLLLLILLAITDPAKSKSNVLRPFKPVEFSDANMRQCLWFAMEEYNKESKDQYVFLVSQILQAQLQLTDRMEYMIETEVARTNCRKPYSNNEICVIQENTKLEKKMNCIFLVGALPWNGDFSMLKKECSEI